MGVGQAGERQNRAVVLYRLVKLARSGPVILRPQGAAAREYSWRYVGLKTKLIFYCKEYNLLEIINRAHSFAIDLSNSPIALYSPNVHPDLSQHLGNNSLIEDGDNAKWETYR